MENKKNHWVAIVIISASVSLLASFLGVLLFKNYLFRDLFRNFFANELNFTEANSPRTNLVIKEAKKVIVNQDVKVDETLNYANDSLVKFFKYQAAPITNEASPESYYRLDQPLFSGLVVTADGWVMAAAAPETVAMAAAAPKTYVVVANDKKVYLIDQIINDKKNSLAFFHLADAANLPVRNFLEFKDLNLGQTLLFISNNQIYLSEISAKEFVVQNSQAALPVRSSDYQSGRLMLSNIPADASGSGFIFNLGGEVAAIAVDKQFRPIGDFKASIKSLLTDKKISLPSLGVNYINLSSLAIVPSVKNSGFPKNGAWLYPTTLAIVKNSAADKAGLKAGDVIVSVDDQEISADLDLNSLVSAYAPGDKVKISFWRLGEMKNVEIILEELK